ncbi:MAG: GTP-binding protein [Thermoplasmata archaeon]
MVAIEEQIKAIEEEITRTKYNKKTEAHIGRLKAKLARLQEEAEKRKASKVGTGKGYAVRKSGMATVALIGFPSVGKSTLLNKITSAKSEVAAYEFTTLTCIPGLLLHRNAKIQILDLPGIIRGASSGKGRGKEVIAVARTSDMVLFMLDPFEPHIDVLVQELYFAGIRLNQKPPQIFIKRTPKGGIVINTTVRLTKLSEAAIRDILQEYGIVSANVVIREDIDMDQLIDSLVPQSRYYLKAIVALNKVDLAMPEIIEQARQKLSGWKVVEISADKEKNLDVLKDAIFDALDFIRVYLKPQGGEADMKEPLVIKGGSTVGDVCDALHRDFRAKFRYAQIWGKSAKFPGQTIGIDHTLVDEDILTIIIRK